MKEILIDASLSSGWRGTLDKDPVQGQWNKKEMMLPVNLLELRAVHLALLYSCCFFCSFFLKHS